MEDPALRHPFSKIGICLSGGGYRATSFSLGVLSYLNEATFNGQPLLQHVKAISTVSGGTIAGMAYALSTTQGKSFDEIFNELLIWMRDTDLITESLELMKSPDSWCYPDKNRNLINAFAELYDKHLTDGATFSAFQNLKDTHLEMICFNATEFTSGTAYRFQKAVKGNPVFGNRNGLQLNKQIYNHIRLADIIAASSCFPGGFEPIEMPRDFFRKDSEPMQAFMATKKPYTLMDGGIVDNQGLSSLLAYGKDKNFDLFLAADVSSPHMEEYKPAEVNSTGSLNTTLRNLERKIKNRYYWAHYASLAFTLTGLGIQFTSWNPYLKGLSLGLGMATMALFIVTLWLNKWVTQKAGSIFAYLKNKVPDYLLTRLQNLPWKDIRFYHAEVFVLNRARSLSLLVGSVFMKQIRRLHYNDAYDEVSREKINIMECMVKELTDIDFNKYKADYEFMASYFPEFGGSSYREILGEELLKITTQAAEMGTTLWFTEDNKKSKLLDYLVISGRFTCCHNLLIYTTRLLHTEKRLKSYSPQTRKEIQTLQQRLYSDWVKMKTSPAFPI